MMNLYLSAAEYDYHTLLKVAEMAGLAGIIGFHEAGDGYLVTFPQGGYCSHDVRPATHLAI